MQFCLLCVSRIYTIIPVPLLSKSHNSTLSILFTSSHANGKHSKAHKAALNLSDKVCCFTKLLSPLSPLEPWPDLETQFNVHTAI